MSGEKVSKSGGLCDGPRTPRLASHRSWSQAPVSGPIRPLSVKKEGKKEKKEKHEQMKAVQAGCSEKISLAQLSKVEQEALQQTGFPK